MRLYNLTVNGKFVDCFESFAEALEAAQERGFYCKDGMGMLSGYWYGRNSEGTEAVIERD